MATLPTETIILQASEAAISKEELKSKRTLALCHLRTLSIIKLILCILSIGFGIGDLVVGSDGGWIPWTIGTALISGAWVQISSVIGLLASRQGLDYEYTTRHSDITPEVHPTVKFRIFVVYVMSAVDMVVLLGSIAAGAVGINFCHIKHDNCIEERKAKLSMSVLTVAVGITLFVTSVLLLKWFCTYHSAFGFKLENRFERRVDQHVRRYQAEMDFEKEFKERQKQQKREQKRQWKQQPQQQLQQHSLQEQQDFHLNQEEIQYPRPPPPSHQELHQSGSQHVPPQHPQQYPHDMHHHPSFHPEDSYGFSKV